MQAEDVCWACRKIVGVVVGETVDDVAGFLVIVVPRWRAAVSVIIGCRRWYILRRVFA